MSTTTAHHDCTVARFGFRARRSTATIAALLAAGAAFAAAMIDFRDGLEPLDDNPSRGPAPGFWAVLHRDGTTKISNPSRFFTRLWDLSEYSGGHVFDGKQPKPGRVGGADIPLDEAALDAIRSTLANARANGAQGIIRFGYAWDDTIGSEPADTNVVRTHIRQLGAVIREFPDVVLAVEGGMFGPWGEMNYSDYVAPEKSVPIMNAWLRELPSTASLLVRSPCYVIWHAGMKSQDFDAAVRENRLDYPGADRIGMYNDGYLGSMGDLGTWHDAPPPSSGLTRDMGVRWLESRPSGVPYGGEFGYCGLTWVTNRGPLCNSSLNIVQEWYRTHLSYLRDFSDGNSISKFLSTLPVEASMIDFPGAPALEEYIGTDLRTFARHHLGYRFVVRDAYLSSTAHPGSSATLRLSVENTGFGDIPWPTRATLRFVSANGGPTSVAAGTTPPAPAVTEATFPVDFDLRKAPSRETSTYYIDVTVPELAGGDYAVLLDVRLDLPYPDGVTATPPPVRFANAGIWDSAHSANRIGTISIR